MKKLLIAAKNMNVGGVEKSLISLLNTISPEEYQVDLLLLEKRGGFLASVPQWVHVIHLEQYAAIRNEVNLPPIQAIKTHIRKGFFSSAWILGYSYLLTKLTGNWNHYYRAVFRRIPMLQEEYDVAISYSSLISYLTWYICYRVNAHRKIGWIHFDISKLSLDSAMIEQLHSQMDKIYVVSREAMDVFTSRYPSLTEKCELRYNVVDRDTILRLAKENVKDVFMQEKATIVTLGRLSAEKGQDIIPEVAVRLKAAGYEFRWLLIGDGNLRAAIEEKIREYGLQEYIILLGEKTNPYPYLSRADVYVQTSVHEGYCISLAEARIFDLPIVSTDFAGAHEQLDGLPNTRIAARNAGAIAAALENMLDEICKE